MKDHLLFVVNWAAWAALLHLVFVQQSVPAMNILQFAVAAFSLMALLLLFQVEAAVQDRAKRPLSPAWRTAAGWILSLGVLIVLVWHGHMVLGALYLFQMAVMGVLQQRLRDYVRVATAKEGAAALSTSTAPR